jgi:hypothetical protein
LRRISDAPEPATAPRPASGDCRPLGNEGGMDENLVRIESRVNKI